MTERVCYLFSCPKFGSCERSRGHGCATRVATDVAADGTPGEVLPGECTTDNGFPLYLPDAWTRRKQFRTRMGLDA